MVTATSLSRHTVIDASAGTGKTYCIEELVLRLLQEGATLDQILLVTFTEKATGELRGRLRERLEKLCREQSDNRLAFEQALDQYDQTAILTIHSFCQRMLQEFAFEQQHDFRAQLVHDRNVLRTCLREIQRKHWQERYGDYLPRMLELSEYHGSKGRSWEDTVLSIAERYWPECGHRLLPDIVPNARQGLASLEDRLRKARREIYRAAKPVRLSRIEMHPWFVGFGSAPINATSRTRCQKKVIRPVLEWLSDRKSAPAIAFARLIAKLDDANATLVEPVSKISVPQLNELCPNLAESLHLLEKLRVVAKGMYLEDQLASHTIRYLRKELQKTKQERGWQSFHDMLTRMYEGLDAERNPAADRLLEALRRRFRFAIVDEFQDTDPLQWQIFKRIFVDDERCKLFVVGDPKQAIFGFRGADLPTYLRAAHQLQHQHNAETLPLATNWRSDDRLIDALNVLFDKGNWFPRESRLTYQIVKPADTEKRPVQDYSGRAALSIVDVSQQPRLTEARFAYARFVAREIKWLLQGNDGKPTIQLGGKQRGKWLDASDICILVRGGADIKPIVKALERESIPYSYYKKTGLWQSDEVLHLQYVLQALSKPDDLHATRKALLTRFFEIPAHDLAQLEEWPARHPNPMLLSHWRNHADRGEWSALFQSLMENTGIVHRELQHLEGERRLANYRYIMTVLEEAAYRHNLELFGVLELIDEKKRQPAEESECQPVESERPKVKVMTMHVSKGLEFPVVFVAGTFTKRAVGKWVRYRDSKERVVFHVRPDRSAVDAAKRDDHEEDRRLLYVALTRAVAKLYVPRTASVSRSQHAGAAVNILAKALQRSQVTSLGPEFAQQISVDSPYRVVRGNGEPLDSQESEADPEETACHLDKATDLFPRVSENIKKRRIVVHSFSSLHRKNDTGMSQFGETVSRADDERDASETQDSIGGPVFGDLVHNVLERVDYQFVAAAEKPTDLLLDAAPTRQIIDDQVRFNAPKLRTRISREQVEEACRQQTADLVMNALRTPLRALSASLCDIPEQDRLHEVEFHFPELHGGNLPPDVRSEEGFLTGFIDLVVRHEGRFYLLDWKTNMLPDYSSGAIADAMQRFDYVRQYRLYMQALERWLRRTQGDAFDFQRDFGGVYYLFLRGMNRRDESSGVFFHKPTADDLRLDLVLST